MLYDFSGNRSLRTIKSLDQEGTRAVQRGCRATGLGSKVSVSLSKSQEASRPAWEIEGTGTPLVLTPQRLSRDSVQGVLYSVPLPALSQDAVLSTSNRIPRGRPFHMGPAPTDAQERSAGPPISLVPRDAEQSPGSPSSSPRHPPTPHPGSHAV